MGHFGFSYIGMLYLLALFIPNIVWTKHMPLGYSSEHENRILGILEKIGEISVSACALIFTDFNYHGFSLWFIISIIAMVMYEAYWIRYFKSDKTLSDMYASFMGIPLAGAALPVIAFLCLGIYGHVLVMVIAVIILGIGHIGIHLEHKLAIHVHES